MIAIVGAGSIGCYVGGRLAATGADVVFVGRQRIADEVAERGLRLTDYRGADLSVPSPVFNTEVLKAAGADLVLVTVKSAATEEVAAQLAEVLRPDAVVVSLQNGVHNAEVLDAALGGGRTIAGMVPFNVVQRGEGVFHQGSEGELEAARDPRLAAYEPVFAAAGLPLTLHDDMPAVLWAKLLLNLNNAINALSGLPLKEELSQRDYRVCLAAAQTETLGILKAAGIKPAKITPLPPNLLPMLLKVPDAVFTRVASTMLEIDPIARSSMADDLELGRTTEVDWINGEVLRLAAQVGRAAPVNEKVVALVRQAEQGGRRDWSGAELRSALHR
ncbi:2-dehydropantoate 2-reductase [Nocardioides marmorisolisilvae]|uniref:2-dehydropantoate 2-reductase n=1 Tax=Nocardioides marmorisolisilvae TaxID=1542737 RepID=A0A3N0DRR5_9ACTN|nr:2-dehydropantoate 2-reductase [Nocardioides marmorisolisilvae]RNL78328.1 2-dehydropantoate 2-reductase [Nocardioides marmorisolisilvae]